MSYLTRKQAEALIDMSPDEIRQLPADVRLDLIIRHQELAARKREAFWNAVQGFALGAIPILSFLGIASLFREKK